MKTIYAVGMIAVAVAAIGLGQMAATNARPWLEHMMATPPAPWHCQYVDCSGEPSPPMTADDWERALRYLKPATQAGHHPPLILTPQNGQFR